MAVEYITPIAPVLDASPKVQIMHDNDLVTLSIETEQVDFAGVERSIDDHSIKAALWDQAHGANRSTLLRGS